MEWGTAGDLARLLRHRQQLINDLHRQRDRAGARRSSILAACFGAAGPSRTSGATAAMPVPPEAKAHSGGRIGRRARRAAAAAAVLAAAAAGRRAPAAAAEVEGAAASVAAAEPLPPLSDTGPAAATPAAATGCSWFRRRPAREPLLPEAQARYVMACVLLALEHLHSQRVMHRDIKPSNIMLSHVAPPKLADFGLAVSIDSDGLAHGSCGTEGFLKAAPEVANRGDGASGARSRGGFPSEGYGPPADVFAAGATLYCMLMGHPPRGAGPSPPLPPPRRMTVSAECRSLLGALTARDPGARPTASQALQHAWFVRAGDLDMDALRAGEVLCPAALSAALDLRVVAPDNQLGPGLRALVLKDMRAHMRRIAASRSSLQQQHPPAHARQARQASCPALCAGPVTAAAGTADCEAAGQQPVAHDPPAVPRVSAPAPGCGRPPLGPAGAPAAPPTHSAPSSRSPSRPHSRRNSACCLEKQLHVLRHSQHSVERLQQQQAACVLATQPSASSLCGCGCDRSSDQQQVQGQQQQQQNQQQQRLKRLVDHAAAVLPSQLAMPPQPPQQQRAPSSMVQRCRLRSDVCSSCADAESPRCSGSYTTALSHLTNMDTGPQQGTWEAYQVDGAAPGGGGGAAAVGAGEPAVRISRSVVRESAEGRISLESAASGLSIARACSSSKDVSWRRSPLFDVRVV